MTRYLDVTLQHIVICLFDYAQGLENHMKACQAAIGKMEKQNQAHLQSRAK